MEYMTAMDGARALELGKRLGGLGVLAVGAGGGELAWMLARCAGCGAALAGADVLFHDGTTPAAGAWLAGHYELRTSLFFLEEDGRAGVWLHDGEGRPMGREDLPPAADWAGPVGTWDRLTGTDSSHAAHRVGANQTPGLAVSVLPGTSQKPLIAALERLGCEVLSRPWPEAAVLRSDRSGFCLTVRSGAGEERFGGADALAAAVEWCRLQRRERPAVPAFGRTEEKRL